MLDHDDVTDLEPDREPNNGVRRKSDSERPQKEAASSARVRRKRKDDLSIEPYDSKTKGAKTPPLRLAKESYLCRFWSDRSFAAERCREAAE